MSRSYNLATLSCFVAQGLAVVLGFAVLTVWPPRRGEYLLVPIGRDATASLLPIAVSEHALLIGAGPLPHSYVVRGDRSLLASVMMAHGIILLAASGVACGSSDGAA